MTNFRSFSDILKNEFEQRASINPSYSLRAFARDLNLSAPRLSNILNQKEGISVKAAIKICNQLGLNELETEYILILVESQFSRDRKKKELAKQKLDQLQESKKNMLDLDVFQAISKWYHFAILELIDNKDFRPEIKWMSKKLGLTSSIVEIAWNRLIKMGMIEQKNGRYVASSSHDVTPTDIPSKALKNFYIDMHEIAKRSLFEDSIELRDFSSVTFSFRQSRVKEVKQAIQGFRQQFISDFAQDQETDSVYYMQINLLPLTKKFKLEEIK